jgi:hypothetical protein
MKILIVTSLAVAIGLIATGSTAAKTELDAAGFAQLCNAHGQDFVNPFEIQGNLDVHGGTGTVTGSEGCNLRVAPGARLRFDHVSLTGCGLNFNMFGGNGSKLVIRHSRISMGNQTYFLFDAAVGQDVRISHSTLDQCGQNDFSNVIVTADSFEGTGGRVAVDHSTLRAAETGSGEDFGRVIVFAPTGRVHVHHNVLAGEAFLIGTFAGGTCRAEHNTPEVACIVF